MSDRFEIVTTETGVRQCRPMPSTDQLDAFYAEKYFQSNDIYTASYDDTEISFFLSAVQRKIALLDSVTPEPTGGRRTLEVGVGEGWSLRSLADAGFDVIGVDYSDFACATHNPGLLDRLRVGAPESVLSELAHNDEKFEVIWLDNVLEHSPDPAGLLGLLTQLSHDGTRLVVEVPNDYSDLQLLLLEEGRISRAFWERIPEHLSYFRPESLSAFGASCGWQMQRMIGDFPIDLYLLDDASNYVERPEVGKAAHRARLAFERVIQDRPVEDVLRYLEAGAAIGIARNIIAVFTPG